LLDTETLAYLSAILAGLLDLWAAVPFVLFLKLNPLVAMSLVALASSCGAILVIYVATLLRERIAKRFGATSFVGHRTARFMEKYGTAGLGLLSPMILGPVLTSIGAVALGANPRKLAAYTVIGAVVWSLAIGVLLSARKMGE